MPDIKTKEVDRKPKLRDRAKKMPKELAKSAMIEAKDRLKDSFNGAVDKGKDNDPVNYAQSHMLEKGEALAEKGGKKAYHGGVKLKDTAVKKYTQHKQVKERKRELEKLRAEKDGASSGHTGGDTQSSARPSGQAASQNAQKQAAQRKAVKGRTGNTTLQKKTVQNGKPLIKQKQVKKGIKSAKKASKTGGKAKKGIKTANRAVKDSAQAAKMSAKAAKQAAIRSRQIAQAAAKAAKVAVKSIIQLAKATAAAMKSAAAAIASLGWVAIIIIAVLAVIFGICAAFSFSSSSSPDSTGGGTKDLSEEVLAYTPLLQQYAEVHGIPEYLSILQAIMMQESGGRGPDPMQSSECGYNREYPNVPNGITDPEYSINVGVENFAECLRVAGCENPYDMNNLYMALQSYNMGTGFISWAKANFGGYSETAAQAFSDMKVSQGWKIYGDPLYVQHVMQYVAYSSAMTGTGMFQWPVPSTTNITSPFGWRTISGGREHHNGVDISSGGIRGKPIIAAASGTVVDAVTGYGEGSLSSTAGYGNYVKIDHGGGYVSIYGHCSSVAVQKGDVVRTGQVIAYVGNSGRSSGPHLHFEIRIDNNPVNPMQFFE